MANPEYRQDGAGASPVEGEEEELDTQRLKEIAGFVLRAPRRHPLPALLAFVLTLAFGMFVAAFWPRSYWTGIRILAQHNLVLPALDNPNRAVPREADSPTKNAADTIMRRDNIISLMKELNLLDRWQTTRQPILRVKDRIFLALFGPKPEEERRLDLIGLLEKRLTVATDESSINVSIEWPDRQMSFEIMALVEKNFLEARYDSNVSVIEDAIRILQERAEPQSKEVDAALDELLKVDAARKRALSPPAPSATARGLSAPRASAPTPKTVASSSNDATTDTATQLEEVRREIRTVEDDNRRRVTEAQNQLVDARATLGPLHPTVVALTEKVAQLSVPPPELPALRGRERELVAQVAKGSEPVVDSGPRKEATGASSLAPLAAANAATTPELSVERSLLDLRDDPPTALARSKLQAASAKYNELLSRIEAANIELEVTRASFKYQYSIVKPPELARKPSKPNVLLILAASFVLALFFMIALPTCLDLGRGRFVEPWQIERRLKLPVLGELVPPM